ncbi:MAG: sulfurtransferase [Candidatus Polarisedimenticolaceae bacterium]|nr:sulfurtransferase [Candidatus Polarisedimenticolaceae bacterium]
MKIKLITTALLLLAACQSLFATTPLVTTDWLVNNLQQTNLRIIDLQPKAGYKQIHITGAIHSDYGQWRQKDKRGIKLIPRVAALERLIGSLGIDNQTHVVLVPFGRSAGDIASATRVYWTLKAVGHDKVSILDGGLIGYAEYRDNPLESNPNLPAAKRFKAHLRNDYLVNIPQVKAAIDSKTQLVDARSIAEFSGERGIPGRSGTIPTSVNLPFNKLIKEGGAFFHPPKQLRNIFTTHQVSLEGEQLSYCQSGHRASLSWFVAHELLGNQQAKLYDGSMQEWAVTPSLPLE